MPKPQPKLNTLNLDGLRRYYTTYNTEAGLRVRARRRFLKLTMQQLAELVGCQMQTISKVENGDIVPRDYLKAAIALRLAVEVADLWPQPSREVLAREAA